MIHAVQCLCGPERHTIFAVMYDDEGGVTPKEAAAALEALIETLIEERKIRRRCEICDKPIKQFWYEDSILKEQDWDKAQAELRLSEAKQALSRNLIQAMRKGAKN